MVRRRHPVTRLVADSPGGGRLEVVSDFGGKPDHQPMRPSGPEALHTAHVVSPAQDEESAIIETKRRPYRHRPTWMSRRLAQSRFCREREPHLVWSRWFCVCSEAVYPLSPLQGPRSKEGGRTWLVAEVRQVSPTEPISHSNPQTVADSSPLTLHQPPPVLQRRGPRVSQLGASSGHSIFRSQRQEIMDCASISHSFP